MHWLLNRYFCTSETLPLYPSVANVWIGAYDFESATGIDVQENVASGWMWSDGTPYNYINTASGNLI